MCQRLQPALQNVVNIHPSGLLENEGKFVNADARSPNAVPVDSEAKSGKGSQQKLAMDSLCVSIPFQ
jgi:hypothetical protein